jgi:hypothetical protein
MRVCTWALWQAVKLIAKNGSKRAVSVGTRIDDLLSSGIGTGAQSALAQGIDGCDRVDFPAERGLGLRDAGVRIPDGNSALQESLGRACAIGVVVGAQPEPD